VMRVLEPGPARRTPAREQPDTETESVRV
jgi:hypothetical protein